VGGIHGVGKGTICKDLSSRYQIPHFSSSQLLKWDEISTKENKRVANFDETQNRLLVGIEKNIPDEVPCFLDGHFCLFNSIGDVERISFSTFRQINPLHLYVVTTDVNIIKKRLESRDKKKYSSTVLAEMQNKEVEYAKEIALKLDIGLAEINNVDYRELEKTISEIKSYE